MWPDALIVVVIAVGWVMWLDGPVARLMPVCTDTYRDAAYVENILEGRIWDDPSLSGLPYWYAPGGPLLYAAVSKVTGIGALELYSGSILWINVWVPVGLFLVVRRYWDRLTGVVALLMIGFGSRWWQTHVAMPMPPIQGGILVLLSLAVWRVALLGGMGWSVLLGVVLAACTWQHIVSAVVVSSAIGCHALFWTRGNRDEGRFTALKRAGVAGGVCAVLVWPLLWHLLTIPWNNMGPPRYYALQLSDPAFALHSATPLLIPLAIVGLLIVARQPRGPAFVVLSYLVVGLVGQGAGYLRRCYQWPVPTLLPHEFQWHGQAAVGVLAAVGTVYLSGRMCGGVQSVPRRWLGRLLTVAVLVTLVVAPDRLRAFDRIGDGWVTARCSPDVQATMEWIRKNTAITDVFACGYLPAYCEVAGRTGRKLIMMPELRANMAADVVRRRRDWHRLQTTEDTEEFLAIAVDGYGARFTYLDQRQGHLLDRWSRWDIMEIAYRSPNGERTILRIIDDRPGLPLFDAGGAGNGATRRSSTIGQGGGGDESGT